MVAHLGCRVIDLPVRRPSCGRHLIADLALPQGQVAHDIFI